MNGFLASLEQAVPVLRRYAMAMLADQRGADDAVRTCLARALDRPLHDSGEAAKLRVWLLAMMYRELTARSRPRRRGLPSSPVGNIVSAVASTELSRAFGGLALEQRSAVFLISVEDLSYAAAGEVMGMPAKAVVNLLKGGREQLRLAVGAGVSGAPRGET
jgi:RNA polymerase sigma-70 factor (ECF subfamily)